MHRRRNLLLCLAPLRRRSQLPRRIRHIHLRPAAAIQIPLADQSLIRIHHRIARHLQLRRQLAARRQRIARAQLPTLDQVLQLRRQLHLQRHIALPRKKENLSPLHLLARLDSMNLLNLALYQNHVAAYGCTNTDQIKQNFICVRPSSHSAKTLRRSRQTNIRLN